MEISEKSMQTMPMSSESPEMAACSVYEASNGVIIAHEKMIRPDHSHLSVEQGTVPEPIKVFNIQEKWKILFRLSGDDSI